MAIQGDIVDVHVDRMKLYLPHVDGPKIVLNYYKPHRQVPEDYSWIVDKIVAHRTRGGQREWKVQWKGHDHDADSWEPASSFVGHFQSDWIAYNKRHHIDVPWTSLIGAPAH